VGVQDVNPLATNDPGQPSRAMPVESGPPIEHLDRKPLGAKLLTQAPQLIEADEQEPIISVELPRQPGGQDLGSSHLKAVQDLADRGEAGARRRPEGIVKPG
jgi:hypothetical protein